MTDDRVSAARKLGARIDTCALCFDNFVDPRGVDVYEYETGCRRRGCCSLHCAMQLGAELSCELSRDSVVNLLRQRDMFSLATHKNGRWDVRPEGRRMLSEEALEATGQR